jgi:hypothetical protein
MLDLMAMALLGSSIRILRVMEEPGESSVPARNAI